MILTTMLTCAALLGAEATTRAPKFTAANQLVRPEGYREWVFLSSGFGMTYTDPASHEAPRFTNVYINPEAYREFISTGKFPDGTVMVLEIRRSESKGSINQGGHYQNTLVGIEASVKDSKRFAEKWAYFSFIGDKDEALPQAEAFPKEACWTCHNQHGASDNVFTQFYPALREARGAK
ncbi:MAG: cytochrome P460 family protein [Terriglobia bacterium]